MRSMVVMEGDFWIMYLKAAIDRKSNSNMELLSGLSFL